MTASLPSLPPSLPLSSPCTSADCVSCLLLKSHARTFPSLVPVMTLLLSARSQITFVINVVPPEEEEGRSITIGGASGSTKSNKRNFPSWPPETNLRESGENSTVLTMCLWVKV